MHSTSSYRSSTYDKIYPELAPKHAASALAVTDDFRTVETCSTRCTCTTKEMMHGHCLAVLLTNLTPRGKGPAPRLEVIQILEFQDPAAARTWGRHEAVAPELLGEAEENLSPGSERESSRWRLKMQDSLRTRLQQLPTVILAATGRSGSNPTEDISVRFWLQQFSSRIALALAALEARASTYQQLAIQSRACPMNKDRGICQSMTSLAIRRFIPQEQHCLLRCPELISLWRPVPHQHRQARMLRKANHSDIRTSLATRFVLRTDRKCLAYRRRADLIIYQTGTARATAHEEEEFVAVKVPKAIDTKPFPCLRKVPRPPRLSETVVLRSGMDLR
ncbi:uncharacterized protein M421DRAFT_388449 [Didymella exigua CBS 183.55]|uniref:Uncharacterized protein n=1 Tax=Didymella exigua CBS 183.55 TaxID=1150837 RepID=A0A6A5S1S3_9PLEO|nr:uncharacterized protein M421DRAFT_388449 [Didymella exigua CBS 183.55]KAF1934072.1 hypothetical protein M421DRAFT_388449 [Didymella exigua CBS 183.55]